MHLRSGGGAAGRPWPGGPGRALLKKRGAFGSIAGSGRRSRFWSFSFSFESRASATRHCDATTRNTRHLRVVPFQDPAARCRPLPRKRWRRRRSRWLRPRGAAACSDSGRLREIRCFLTATGAAACSTAGSRLVALSCTRSPQQSADICMKHDTISMFPEKAQCAKKVCDRPDGIDESLLKTK